MLLDSATIFYFGEMTFLHCKFGMTGSKHFDTHEPSGYHCYIDEVRWDQSTKPNSSKVNPQSESESNSKEA